MGAAHARRLGQRGEPLQRSVHLRRGSLEQATAAGGEEGIAAKNEVRADIGEVPAGVAGDLPGVELQAELGNFHRLALAQPMGEAGDVLGGRSVHGNVVVGAQCRHAAGVVGVMVRDEDGGQAQAAGDERRAHRGGLGRVDHHGVAAIVQQPDIVIAQSGDGFEERLGHDFS